MSDSVERRLARERRRARVEAGILNTALLFYFFFAVYYLWAALTADFGRKPDLRGSVVLALGTAGAALAILWTASARSPGRILIERTNKLLKVHYRPPTRPFLRTTAGVFTLLVLGVTLVLGVLVTEVSLRALLSPEGAAGAGRIIRAFFKPEMGILGMVLSAMFETIMIALMATAFALPASFALGFLSARNLMKGSAAGMAVYTVLRILFNLTRSVEPLIWAIILSVWVGIGPFAGMLALMLHSVASLVKQYSEVIEDVDRGPMEAIEATGANPVQVAWFAIVPQVVLPFLSFTIYRWDINIRMATVIGLVGGGGIGTLLMQYLGLARWNEVGTIILIIALVVWVMDYLTARIREAIY